MFICLIFIKGTSIISRKLRKIKTTDPEDSNNFELPIESKIKQSVENIFNKYFEPASNEFADKLKRLNDYSKIKFSINSGFIKKAKEIKELTELLSLDLVHKKNNIHNCKSEMNDQINKLAYKVEPGKSYSFNKDEQENKIKFNQIITNIKRILNCNDLDNDEKRAMISDFMVIFYERIGIFIFCQTKPLDECKLTFDKTTISSNK